MIKVKSDTKLQKIKENRTDLQTQWKKAHHKDLPTGKHYNLLFQNKLKRLFKIIHYTKEQHKLEWKQHLKLSTHCLSDKLGVGGGAGNKRKNQFKKELN